MAYQPIEDYGVIGNLRTAALVGLDGSIDWLCLPRFDSPSVFGRVLDWGRGGCFAIAPSTAAAATHAYRTHSNVLETVARVGERTLRRMPSGVALTLLHDYVTGGSRFDPDTRMGLRAIYRRIWTLLGANRGRQAAARVARLRGSRVTPPGSRRRGAGRGRGT